MDTGWQAFERVAEHVGEDWSNIRKCKRQADEALEKLSADDDLRSACPADTALVVYGSLARGDLTQKSDIDWTLLIDGQANTDHGVAPHGVKERLAYLVELEEPNKTGAFGALSFSHDLVHRVGGEFDSNRNTTQRVLLLLESKAPAGDDGVRKRVVNQILRRYLDEDETQLASEPTVPRFLLNDIVRFWRTMAVDFPAKQRDRNWDGWALRNLKLRLSRKLIFASGLLVCLRAGERSNEMDRNFSLLEYLVNATDKAPMEVLAEAVDYYGLAESAGADLLSAYDSFLGLLCDHRGYLGRLSRESAKEDPTFRQGRDAAEKFQRGLTTLFFDGDAQLRELSQRYGVF